MGTRWNGKLTSYTDLRRAAISSAKPTKKKKKGKKPCKKSSSEPSPKS